MLENNSNPVVIFITCKDSSEAEKIAGSLVEQRLIACGNITTEITSIFQWKGKIENDQEVLLIAKSRNDIMDNIIAEVKKLHSYDTPEIIAMPIVSGSSDYLEWITAETTPSQTD
ncbi:MAG: divalent cation tolerance protein CutA [Candidatus Marinimicrobia bacterium]|nr:divalent cation tolerance protein CutA [Candidatus Neomarinimicrobiota bacterium]